MPEVNPEILIWARETAGLSLEDAAKAVGINDARGKVGADRLAEIEAGERAPSRPQLLRMSKKYRRPLLTFYLDEPPRKGDRGEDFRTLPGAQPPSYDPTLDALIRDIRTRQDFVKSILEDEESPPLPFIGSFGLDARRDRLVDRITQTIEFSRGDFRNQNSIENAFAYLRTRIESAGVFVVLMGNLGSHHSNIPVEVFRGFAIADPIAPFVVVNDQDARAAWSFTALHEVAHLWLGLSGVSGAQVDTRVERLCNDVASEILLPSFELAELDQVRTVAFEDATAMISDFASARRLSRSMVAYKLYLNDLLPESRWRELANHFRQQWLEGRRRRETGEDGGGGPSYYVVRRHRLGQSLLHVVSRALGEGNITHTKAGKVLGVKPRNVEPLLRGISTRGGA